MTRVSRNRLDHRKSRGHHGWRATAWRSGLLLVALLLSVASSNGSKGERAETGQCPFGEVCSPDTPSGLYFKGATFGDGSWIPARTVGYTAVGGEQSLEIDPVGWLEHVYDFRAECVPSVFSVTSINPPELRVHANTAGDCFLRIVDPQNGELYDRLEIHSLAVEQVQVSPGVPSAWSTAWSDDSLPLFYGGAPIPWLARLTHGYDRLVDETLAFATADGSSAQSITPLRWDVAEILPVSDATHLAVVVTTGSGATGLGEVELVHVLDRIEDDPQHAVPSTMDASSMGTATFLGLTPDGRFVNGLDWSITLIDPNGVISDRADMWGTSAIFWADQPGTWQLEISAANITRTWEIMVIVPPPPPFPTPVPPPTAAPPPPGQAEATLERAPPRGAPGWRASRCRESRR